MNETRAELGKIKRESILNTISKTRFYIIQMI